MKEFRERLKDKDVILGDGAMGTMLQKVGLVSGEIPEDWNEKHPEKVLDIHKQYIEAGAELIEANTFGGSFIRLKEAGLEAKLTKLNRLGVELAKEAAEGKHYVSSSIGPTGKILAPYGPVSKEEVLNSYRMQIEVLVEAGVDALHFETMIDLEELILGVKAAKEFDIPIIAQMNLNTEAKSLMGDSVEEIVSRLDELQVDLMGINCTPGAKKTLPLIEEYNKFTDTPLSVFPNAGAPILKGEEVYYPEVPSDYIPFVKPFIENNVKLIGGCCGSTPELIAAMKAELNRI